MRRVGSNETLRIREQRRPILPLPGAAGEASATEKSLSGRGEGGRRLHRRLKIDHRPEIERHRLATWIEALNLGPASLPALTAANMEGERGDTSKKQPRTGLG